MAAISECGECVREGKGDFELLLCHPLLACARPGVAERLREKMQGDALVTSDSRHVYSRVSGRHTSAPEDASAKAGALALSLRT